MGYVLLVVLLLALFVVSIFYEVVQCSGLLLISICRAILSFFMMGFNDIFFIFAILTSGFFMLVNGVDAFDSGTDRRVIFRREGDTITGKQDVNHPIQAFFETIVAGLIVAGIEYIIFSVMQTFTFMTIICAIESVIALIFLIKEIRFVS